MKEAKILNTQSAVANFTGAPIDVGDAINYSIQAVITGSNVVGSFKLQASNNGDDWDDITGSTVAVSSSSNAFPEVASAGHWYVRPVWTYTSGTGNITLYFVSKGRLPVTSNR
jgi:hypothetical protein